MRSVFITASFFFSTTTALAADLGQYRQGNPYESVIAAGADICENHCAGDALCRSWNYVKVNPQAPGVCEFNNNDVPPVPSAISISGSNVGETYRTNVLRGGTNTLRVGTQRAQTPHGVKRSVSPQRTIIREPVPTARNTHNASTRPRTVNRSGESLTAQQNRNRGVSPTTQPVAPQTMRVTHSGAQSPILRPVEKSAQRPIQFQHDLGGRSIPLVSQPRPNMRPRALSNSSRHRRHNQGPNTRHNSQEMRVLQSQNTQGQTQRPQEPVRNLVAAQQHQSVQTGQPYPPQMEHPRVMPPKQPLMRRPASNPAVMGDTVNITTEQVEQSLFGKLNDDVKVPNSGAAVPNDPELPISTAASRPTQSVYQSPLGDLAGGPG